MRTIISVDLFFAAKALVFLPLTNFLADKVYLLLFLAVVISPQQINFVKILNHVLSRWTNLTSLADKQNTVVSSPPYRQLKDYGTDGPSFTSLINFINPFI